MKQSMHLSFELHFVYDHLPLNFLVPNKPQYVGTFCSDLPSFVHLIHSLYWKKFRKLELGMLRLDTIMRYTVNGKALSVLIQALTTSEANYNKCTVIILCGI